MEKSLFLQFSKELIEKPVITRLIRNHSVEINILEARITPNEEGSMFVRISGNDVDLEKALEYLLSSGVRVTVKPRRIIWTKETCTSCGACIPQCPSEALVIDRITHEVEYDHEKCIACFLCIPACPYDALEEADLERMGV
jgi:L-aspartate semialdehyde sulfurtransferase ferredoxin